MLGIKKAIIAQIYSGKSVIFQVVMPTVEADVAFGLGKLNLTRDEIRSNLSKALDAVGMSDYVQVGFILQIIEA